MTSIALVMTVRNERDLLRSNILYHRYLGVKIFYVFLDGTTDDTQDTVADLDCVVLSHSVSADQFLESDERRRVCATSGGLREAITKLARHHTARQVLNAYVAWEGARDNGIEWLISLDPDELVWPNIGPIMEGQLGRLLEGQEKHVDQVIFRPLEVIQKRREYDDVFREAVLFKRRFQVHRDVYDPLRRRRRKFEFVPTRFHRVGLYRIRRFTWWYGHRWGKWAVRIGPGVVPGIHSCVRLDGGSLHTEEKGYLLHYIMYNHIDFIRKYRNFSNRPDTFLSGRPVRYRKRLWRDIVNNPSFSDTELIDYYGRWIAFADSDIQRLRTETQEVTAVRDVFDTLFKREERPGGPV